MAKVSARSIENYQILIRSGNHSVLSDEPAPDGDGLGPDPYELLLSALGSCTVMTVLMYARRKQWPLDSAEAVLSFGRIHAEDCAHCEQETGMVESIQVRLRLRGGLDDQQRRRLLEIASRCPVRKTLGASLHIDHELWDGEEPPPSGG